ncbi:probable cytochrome P450 301a1, mitochondrial [Cylas formicarius]|uniref:probable cytochrome P450 301a1, mitochondrial n=1 Tax=Cylas formicarius TaxID=197179 RepID=UPI002958908E|nr:probable cytochrome P450 301a1, mitochondrial [Cylas formicarius]
MKYFKQIKRFVSKSYSSGSLAGADIKGLDLTEQVENIFPYESIPGPTPLPVLGNTWRFIPYIGDFQIEHIDKVARRLYEQYGKIVKIEGLLGRPDMIFLFDPYEIEKVFRREDAMPYRPSMPSLNFYKHVYRKDFFGKMGGVISVHGENWQKFRSKVNQIMLQPKSAKMYAPAISKASQEFVERIRHLRNKESEMPDDFLNEIHKWSLESLARIALDVRLGCMDRHPSQDTQQLIDAINTFFINVPILELKIPFWRLYSTPTFKEYIDALDTIKNICLKYIEKAMRNLQTEDGDSQNSILRKVLHVEKDPKVATVLALDMFLVGIDTTSNAVASILYQLAIHPKKQEKLHQEVERVLDSQQTIETDALEAMSYLKACIKETMRLYPVVIGNGRQTTSDCVIRGYRVPKGVQIIFQHYVISNEEEYFAKSCEFLPERWLKGFFSKEHHPFASLPFGFGKRMCLGKRFAELEIQMLIAKIIQNYRIEYHHQRLNYFIHPMYTPNGPLRLRFVNKN